MNVPDICSQRSLLTDLPSLWDISPLVVQEMDHANLDHQAAWTTLIQKSFPAKDGGWLPPLETSILQHPHYDVRHTYFLMDGDTYVGVISEAVFRRNTLMGVPHYLGVDPAYRNRGLGKWLLLYVLHQLKTHGLSRCEGESTMAHQTALLIHFVLGMTPKYTRDEWNTSTTGDPCDDYKRLYEAWVRQQCEHSGRVETNSEFYIPSARVPLSHPALYGAAVTNVLDVLARRQLSGDGPYTRQCQEWLETNTPCAHALLTHSGTGALELAALIANIGPGDEVIMPSFTYPSTASAFALRGAIPVFVDIRPDTLNMDETLIEAALTPRTRTIVPVHYGGVFCNMDVICDIAHRHGLYVIEDAAHAIGSVPTTQRGHMSVYSFHDTKNIVCGEGGALLIHDASLIELADILWFCGTDRRAFLDGRVDHYTWQDIGSSFPPSELQSAVLWSQLNGATVSNLTAQRQHIWNMYHQAFLHRDVHHRPTTGHNAHVYYVLVPGDTRPAILHQLHQWNIGASFHYVPLHSSPAGQRYGRISGSMTWTDTLSRQIIRLPLYAGNEGMHHSLILSVIQKCQAAGI